MCVLIEPALPPLCAGRDLEEMDRNDRMEASILHVKSFAFDSFVFLGFLSRNRTAEMILG